MPVERSGPVVWVIVAAVAAVAFVRYRITPGMAGGRPFRADAVRSVASAFLFLKGPAEA